MSSKIDWSELEREYVTHPELTGMELSRRHGIPAATVNDHIRSGGWARKRKDIQSANTQIAVQRFQADDLAQKTQRVEALAEVVRAWLDSPTKDAKAADVVGAIKQLEVMMGGVSDRSERRVIIYEIPPNIFPEAPTFEGTPEDVIDAEAVEIDAEGNP